MSYKGINKEKRYLNFISFDKFICEFYILRGCCLFMSYSIYNIVRRKKY